MDILALIIAIVAFFCFLAAISPRYAPRLNWIALGLALTVAAWIVQAVALTGDMIRAH